MVDMASRMPLVYHHQRGLRSKDKRMFVLLLIESREREAKGLICMLQGLFSNLGLFPIWSSAAATSFGEQGGLDRARSLSKSSDPGIGFESQVWMPS